MTMRPVPIPIPISSLLPPSSTNQAGPSTCLHTPSYIVGSLPPTSPIHLALNYLTLADRLPCHPTNAPNSSQPSNDIKGKGKEKEKTESVDGPVPVHELRAGERVLIITGSKGSFADSIQEEDEDYFRNRSGYWEVMKRLKRVDMRYCPTPSHLQLLLTLLTESDSRFTSKFGTQYLESTPSLVILWDIAGMLMIDQVPDENEPPPLDQGVPSGEDEEMHVESNPSTGKGRTFISSVCMSDYMDVLSASRAAIDHLNSLHPSVPPTQLIILEPSLNTSSTLPILPPLTSENEDPRMSKSARERRVNLIDGARWLFGKDSIDIIHQLSGEKGGMTSYFSLSFETNQDEKYQMKRRKCPKAEYTTAEILGEEKPSGWTWEWVSS
ncbi:uncharacterized protein IL334_003293 [Kwoniella shivajii]|uniref:Uncharacterized protein n=1 Tax=Kwoniella shivajii TaxID=564305 RepID=A0ABZ1CX63_9TREE|nr:hypothetical protein IL334_003293 [Kwoniella shivajii]